MSHSVTYSIEKLMSLIDSYNDVPKEFEEYLLKKQNFNTYQKKHSGNSNWRKIDQKKSWLVQKGGSTLQGDDKLLAKIKGTLNKISNENYQEMINQLQEYEINTLNNLRGFVKILFNKALNESQYINIYVHICETFMKYFIIDPLDDKKYTFRGILLNTCQESFEKYTSKKDKFDDEEEEIIFKGELFGCIRFIGELYNIGIINNEILKSCIVNLLSKVNTNELFTIETLCILIEAVGDEYKKRDGESLKKYLGKINELKNTGIKPRLCFLIEGSLDIAKERGWF